MLEHRVRRIERDKQTCGRLQRPEDLPKRGAPPANRRQPVTEDEWLGYFESLCRDGYFDSEPDFPTALAIYHAALQPAKAQAEPPWDPPEDFLLGAKEQRRLYEWRHGGVYRRVDADGNVLPEGTDIHGGLCRRFDRFSEVQQGWQWLSGMALRGAQGVPPLTVAEFAELASWFEANQDRLTVLSRVHRAPGRAPGCGPGMSWD
jgi:hypothetical protein